MRTKRNTILFVSIMAIFPSLLSAEAAGFDGHGGWTSELATRLVTHVMLEDEIVTYEAFGAIGDGVHDDLSAICAAHEYANEHGLRVKTKPDATYHLGGKALTAIIA